MNTNKCRTSLGKSEDIPKITPPTASRKAVTQENQSVAQQKKVSSATLKRRAA